jgi:hypothetical protein
MRLRFFSTSASGLLQRRVTLFGRFAAAQLAG